MKSILLSLTFIFFTQTLLSQKKSVEKSVFGIQTGFLGIWAHNESRLSNQLSLRTEVGLNTGIWGGSFLYDKTGFLMNPVLTLEPRWYYNLDKRHRRSKRIDGNSGNFIAIKTSYHPDWFVISNYDNVNIISDLSIIPTWGIRRNIGKHFNFETGIGFGFRYIFGKKAGFLENDNELAANLHLRIGYKF
ncbi:MAG: hypothetical protein MH132_01615 [Hydrotalea sp.]|nr:hypothetical protein [Hydrotalea sp.]